MPQFLSNNNHGYTKHYYVEADRIASKIGGGMSHSGNDFGEHIYVFDISTQNDYGRKSEENTKIMYNHLDSAQSYLGKQYEVLVDVDYRRLQEFLAVDEPEKEIFFFHKDHLGSSTQISDMGQHVVHHIEYLPTGFLFAEQSYYTPEIGIWLSVDPLSDKYPSMSAFMYCAGNPVVLVDPDGRDWFENELTGAVYYNNKMGKNDAGTGAMGGDGWKHMGKNGMFTKNDGYTDSDQLLVRSNRGKWSIERSDKTGDILFSMEMMIEGGGKAEDFMGDLGYAKKPSLTDAEVCEQTQSFPEPHISIVTNATYVTSEETLTWTYAKKESEGDYSVLSSYMTSKRDVSLSRQTISETRMERRQYNYNKSKGMSHGFINAILKVTSDFITIK